MKTLICPKCNQYFYGISRAEALKHLKSFNDYYEKLSKEDKSRYDGKATIKDYLYCFYCHTHYKQMKSCKLVGKHTLLPILVD